MTRGFVLAFLFILLAIPVQALATVDSITVVSPKASSFADTRSNVTFNATVSGTSALNVTFELRGVGGTITTITVLNDTVADTIFNTPANLSTVPAGVYNVTARVSNSSLINITNATIADVLLTNTFFSLTSRTHFSNGTRMNNTNVSVEVFDFSAIPRRVTSVSNLSNSSGGDWANVSVPQVDSLFYKIVVKHYDSENNIDFIGQILPAFPPFAIRNLGVMKFYLKEAGTLNVTVVNASSVVQPFTYQVKDTRLGYAVEEQWDSAVTNALVHVPKDRNYSIMVYPDDSVPISFDWNNFSSTSSYNIDSNSRYNATSRTLHKKFNATTQLPRLSGYVSGDGFTSWDSLRIVPMLLEPGNMVFVGEDGGFPFNLSAFNSPPQSDNFSASTGFFNISVPASTEEVRMVLFAVAKKDGVYYGGYRNLTKATIANGGGSASTLNFTQVFRQPGNLSNITMPDASNPDGPRVNITTLQPKFTLINGTDNTTLKDINAFIEATVDYSSYGAVEFTFVTNLDGSGEASFFLPLINQTGVKEMNVYTSDFAPKRVTFTQSQIVNNQTNVTLKTFNPQAIDTALSGIKIGLFKSNTTCDVPTPGNDCVIASSASLGTGENDFNPFSAVLGGGALSFRMGTSTIEIHYVNVDLLASGPPDALFDDSADSVGTSGGSFDQAWRFGSGGPTIYDYVLVSIPYTESAGSGLDDSKTVSISITKFYEDDFNNPVWNTANNGTNATLLAGNYSHYSAKKSEWQTLIDGTTCLTNVTSTGINASNPCFINTTDNRIWLRLPHFSGTSPKIAGTAIALQAAVVEEEEEDDGGGVATAPSEPSVARTFINPAGGEEHTFELTDTAIPVTELTFVLQNDKDRVRIEVTKLSEKPSGLQDPEGDVYAYLDIDAGDLADSDVREARIRFGVPSAWLEENGVGAEDVRLYRYSDGWNALETELIDDDLINIYEATTPGFSTFAIAAVAPPLQQAVVVPERNETVQEEQLPPVQPKDYTIVLAIGALILIAVGAYAWKQGRLTYPSQKGWDHGKRRYSYYT